MANHTICPKCQQPTSGKPHLVPYGHRKVIVCNHTHVTLQTLDQRPITPGQIELAITTYKALPPEDNEEIELLHYAAYAVISSKYSEEEIDAL